MMRPAFLSSLGEMAKPLPSFWMTPIMAGRRTTPVVKTQLLGDKLA